ncbi:MAG: PPC domain-containing DNA-binding protein [Nitrospinota bacterium]
MTLADKFNVEELIVGNIPFEADLLKYLTEFATERSITVGTISLIGAVKEAKLLFYDQSRKIYNPVEGLDGPFEITSGIGNISLLEEKVFVHLHLTLSDANGRVFGGHLSDGTIMFAGEFSIYKLGGKQLKRRFDETTGLNLWQDE